jgi:ubiquinone/menaquinone biosynthesis C-methylase UbiE
VSTKLATRILLALNRLSPRPHFPERPTPAAYAAWEYGEAGYQAGLMRAAGVSLAVPRVLDVGCGLGGKSIYFAEQGAGYVLGIDRSEPNVQAARRFAAARGSRRTEFVAADSARIPARNGQFDLLLTTDTFEHFAEPGICLAEMARVVRPGGRIVAIFGPFGSPLGSHLYDTLFLPWCHLLFPRECLAEAIRTLAGGRATGLSSRDREEVMNRAEEQIEYFDKELNRMTLRRFRRIVREESSLVLRAWKKWTPAKLRPLTPLLVVPGVDEVLTGLLVMVAERRIPEFG